MNVLIGLAEIFVVVCACAIILVTAYWFGKAQADKRNGKK